MKARLSMAFQDLRGKDGNVVIRKGRSGLVLTPRTSPSNPESGAQLFVRGNLTKAAKTFKGMTSTQAEAWDNYGESITRHNPVSGGTYTSTGINAFVELTTKFLQASPSGTIPMTPPTTAFTGDTITVTATGESGAVEFTASAANASGVKTELLLQPLSSANRKPDPNGYKSAYFVAFASGGMSLQIDAGPGYWAAAYRFVKTATGQATDLIQLPVMTVALSMTEGGKVPAPSKKKAA